MASERVQRILSDVRSLSSEEQAQLEAELFAEDPDAGRAWGEEVDRRAAPARGAPRQPQVIEIDPEAVLELLDARDYDEAARPGLGATFERAAERTLDAIEDAPERYPLGH